MKKFIIGPIGIIVLITCILLSGCTDKVNSPVFTSSQTTNPIITPSQTVTLNQIVTPTSQTSGCQVRVIYSGRWQGSYGSGGSTKSMDGTGTQTFDLESCWLMLVGAGKFDNSPDRLTVEILRNGSVIKSDFIDSQNKKSYALAAVEK